MGGIDAGAKPCAPGRSARPRRSGAPPNSAASIRATFATSSFWIAIRLVDIANTLAIDAVVLGGRIRDGRTMGDSGRRRAHYRGAGIATIVPSTPDPCGTRAIAGNRWPSCDDMRPFHLGRVAGPGLASLHRDEFTPNALPPRTGVSIETAKVCLHPSLPVLRCLCMSPQVFGADASIHRNARDEPVPRSMESPRSSSPANHYVPEASISANKTIFRSLKRLNRVSFTA